MSRHIGNRGVAGGREPQGGAVHVVSGQEDDFYKVNRRMDRDDWLSGG